MKNGIFGKGLTVVIVALFVGMSITSVTGSNVIIKKSSIQPVESDTKITGNHDVGVKEITQPAGPYAPWSPGVYSVKVIVKNYGSYSEINFNVNAKIWEIPEGGNESLYYEDNTVVNVTLNPGGNTTVVFNAVEFREPGHSFGGRGNNVSYRLEITTELAGDENPTNNQQILNFIICYLETDFVDFKIYAMGNGWHGPGGWLVIFYNSSIISALYFYVDGSGGLYTGPPYYVEDGYHTLIIYANDHPIGPFMFRIDGTPPVITLTAERIGFMKWRFSAMAYDETSGVEKVEFYLDNQLLGTVTALPWEYIWTGIGRHTVKAIAYDFAGNNASSPPVTSNSYSRSKQPQNQLLLKFLERFPHAFPILRHLLVGFENIG